MQNNIVNFLLTFCKKREIAGRQEINYKREQDKIHNLINIKSFCNLVKNTIFKKVKYITAIITVINI